jgi:hypothetical protein
MRLPSLSAGRSVVRPTASSVPEVKPSACGMPCGPAFTCPSGCVCQCRGENRLSMALGALNHAGCICVAR